MPRSRRPVKSEPVENVTLQNSEKLMAAFIKYYKGIGLVPEDEWKHFFQSLFTDLPYCFRICENHRKINNVLEGKPGTLGHAEATREYFKNNILPELAEVKINDEPLQIAPLPWYPKQLAWKVSTEMKTFYSTPELKVVNFFVQTEDKSQSVCKQDVSSMIPPLLVDISPNHKVLELCSAPGYMTAQILEQICNSPKKLPDGFVVSNDTNLNYRWPQGTNIYFTHEDAKKYPDLFMTEDHSPENKVLYDRIFIDAPSSNDGQMRSNKKLKAGWNVTKAQKCHKDLKATLRRGVELLELNGQLVYCTNSMNPIENEAVVAAILSEAPQTLELVDVKNRLPDFHVRPGMTSWKVMSQGLVFYDTFESSPAWFQKENEESLFPPKTDIDTFNLDRCLRVMPHDNDTSGFFVAVFTKFGPLPWQEEEEMDVNAEVKKDPDAEKEEEKKKCPYTLPLRVDVNVTVSEIEWTTEVTDEKLNTKSDVDYSRFDLAPMKISKSCIPAWLTKKLLEQSARYDDVAADDALWLQYKEMFDIKRVNPLPNMIRFSQEGKNTVYLYCNPAVKSLIQNNMDITRKSKAQCGGLMMMKTSDGEKFSVQSVLPVLQNVGKRLINVTKPDLVTILEKKEVPIKDLAAKVQSDLNNTSDTGNIYFLYEPKGKNADPKCAILIWREKSEENLKDSYYSRADRPHCLRLCGVDPSKEPETEAAAEGAEKNEEEPMAE
ncbi:tRNA (cytosine(34)-C(5))-methyltransferase [Mactra antiquata]